MNGNDLALWLMDRLDSSNFAPWLSQRPLYTLLIVVCGLTPVWYMPVRRIIESFGYPRTKTGRVRRATMIEWLNAAGCGMFAAQVLVVVAMLFSSFDG